MHGGRTPHRLATHNSVEFYPDCRGPEAKLLSLTNKGRLTHFISGGAQQHDFLPLTSTLSPKPGLFAAHLPHILLAKALAVDCAKACVVNTQPD